MCFRGRKSGVDEEFKRWYACYYNGCIFPFRISALKAASLADFSPTEGFASNIVLNVSRKLMFRKMALILANPWKERRVPRGRLGPPLLQEQIKRGGQRRRDSV